MCQFFSAIVTRTGKVLFTEKDSHETIINRAQLRDIDRHLRHWVRVELRPRGDGWAPLIVDEAEVPTWWTEDAPALTDRVTQIANRVRPARAAYDAIEQPARATYEAIEQSARAAYSAAIQPARAAYCAAIQPARAAADAAAWAAYDAATQSAVAAYEAIERPAWAAYKAALARIPGYCAAPTKAA